MDHFFSDIDEASWPGFQSLMRSMGRLFSVTDEASGLRTVHGGAERRGGEEPEGPVHHHALPGPSCVHAEGRSHDGALLRPTVTHSLLTHHVTLNKDLP